MYIHITKKDNVHEVTSYDLKGIDVNKLPKGLDHVMVAGIQIYTRRSFALRFADPPMLVINPKQLTKKSHNSIVFGRTEGVGKHIKALERALKQLR